MPPATPAIPTVPVLFEARVAARPDAIALVADRELSYGELHRAMSKVAGALAQRGIGRGSVVAVCVDRGADLVASLLGTLWTGAAYVPIDPTFPAHRIREMLEDARPSGVLLSRRHKGLFEGVSAELIAVEDLRGAPPPPHAPIAADVAYIIFTSGSTGRPKGVMVTHRGLSNVLHSVAELVGARSDDRLLPVTTVSFDIAGLELFLPLLVGGTVVIAQREEALDGGVLARLIDRQNVSLMQATPATWRMLVDSGWHGRRGLRALTGGETLARPLADALLDRVDALWNLYGPTETAIWSTAQRVSRREGPVPIGKALANTTLRLVDSTLRESREGELCIGGWGVAKGYLRRDDLTAARFIPDPAAPNERMYRTGDLCRWRDDGVLEFIGRFDHQVKIRGHRVELGDVEAALALDPAVAEVVAGVREDGESNALVAYATLQPGASLTLAELRRHASKRLPGYMLPTSLVVVDQMPRTPSGKTDRKALASLGVPAEPAGVPEARDDLELVLLNVFREVLGVDQVSATDDFFELGGHSLMALRAVREIGQRTGQSLDAGVFFKHRSVSALARVLRERGGITLPATAIDLQPGGDQPPLFCVCGVAVYLALARSLAPDQPVCAIYVDADIEVFHSENASRRAKIASPPTIESLADRYVQEIRARRPSGPYRLLGFSMGGAVAFEVARRLIDDGEQIEMVAMIDTVLAGSVRRRPIQFARHLTWRAAGAVASRATRIVARLMGLQSSVAEPGALAGASPDRRLVQARGKAILGTYRPRPLSISVLLFNAADRLRQPHMTYDETGGWASVVRDRLDIRMVRGGHLDLLWCPERARIVADAIRNHLPRDARRTEPEAAPGVIVPV